MMPRFEGKKNTEGSRKHQKLLTRAVDKILKELIREHPEADFYIKSKITSEEIAKKVNPLIPYESLQNTFINPDGKIAMMKYKGNEYPILISEAKKQGTNDFRVKNGLGKQARGNAIERMYKNISEISQWCRYLDYFPYVMFLYGDDFREGKEYVYRRI